MSDAALAHEGWLQWLIIAPLLLWSAWRVAKQLAPRSTASGQNRLAQYLVKHGHARLGSWLQSGSTEAGCGSGCASCNNCAPTPPAASPESSAPVRWRDSGRR